MRALVLLVAAGLVCGALAVGGYYLSREDPRLAMVGPGCPDGPTVAGIDVSYHQDTIDWKRVRWAGVRFAFVRISDGTTFVDPRFQQNWTGAKANGVLRGSYQYFRPDESPVAQADLVVAALRADPGELAVAIDVETDGGRSPKQLAAGIQIWVERVRARLGIEPLIYASPEFWRDQVGGASFHQPLWLAHYTDQCPTVPAPWTRYTFWQYSQTGRVKGIVGDVDLDVFAGTLDDLRRSPVALANRPQPAVDGGDRVRAGLGR
ncbi:MAG: GH25 family lysozyme [Proteobacteria bacterium]|nr:GH25 family lysozyme [Pseudomonadota bacterium]